MREINLNGYIDDAVWFGDEITPESLHDTLYEAGCDRTEDVHIRLNSYGGNCNAATRMHDDLAAYPGKIFVTVSGTAASAATVLAMAADRLEMTPGSLWMIHNPSVMAVGNERDLLDAIDLLRACKDSIINVYGKRCRLGHDTISDMMDKTTWMDAQMALSIGFIDNIAESAAGGLSNCVLNRADAEKKVQAWCERHRLRPPDRARNQTKEGTHEAPTASTDTEPESAAPAEAEEEAPALDQETPPESAPPAAQAAAPEAPEPRVNALDLEKRLNCVRLQTI